MKGAEPDVGTREAQVEFSLLSSDRPLTDPKNDRLGYAPFAKHLARSILEMPSPEGFVAALYGSWGSGKGPSPTTAVSTQPW